MTSPTHRARARARGKIVDELDNLDNFPRIAHVM